MSFNFEKNNFIVILGAGESGVGAALLAKKMGYEVFVSDYGKIAESFKNQLLENIIAFEEEKHSSEYILEKADLVIKSPGIPFKAPLIQALMQKGVQIIDEIEFASHFTKAKIIAITGSNGKTTTTRLVYHILQTAGLNVGLAGNVGFSLAKQVALGDKDYYALEISSFQLDCTKNFSPDIAILTNITPDHLDRYAYKLENYIASKFRIIQNKKDADTFIYNLEDDNIKYGFDNFWTNSDQENGIAVSMKKLSSDDEYLEVEHTDFKIKKSELTIQGWHNRFNISCAVIAAKKLGISNDKITEALKTFVNEAHRLESVALIEGVEFINDSKATNVDSVFYALEAMTKPVIWIVGGQDKGNDYSPLFGLVREKVKAIVCMGLDNKKIVDSFSGMKTDLIETSCMDDALEKAFAFSTEGDIVLLSPACASFDLFNNYQHRGNLFKEKVKAMVQNLAIKK
jgi:UDP-N-acetylmuramoylalanine--D-glutamate ligase